MSKRKATKSKISQVLLQQGDVLLFSEEKLPAGLKPVQPKNGFLIVAEGEATGHHHSFTLDQEVDLLTDEKGTLWCVVKGEEAVLTHQEHKPVTLKKGVHRIGIVREVDPFKDEVHKVRD
jgi:hypothetical protein